MKVGYLAHPVAPDANVSYDMNIAEIKELIVFLTVKCGLDVQAPYLGNLIAGLPDTDPVIRKRGLDANCRVLEGFDYMLLTGHKISSGMAYEMNAWEDECGRDDPEWPVIDLTGYSLEDIKQVLAEHWPELRNQ